MDDTAGRTRRFMAEWMRTWEDADEAAVDRAVALFGPDSTYRATPFTEAVGREGVRSYMSMVRTQCGGRGRVEYVGVAGEYGVFLWEIEYGVLPRAEWPQNLGGVASSPAWASYVAFAVAAAGTRVQQSGVGLVRFDGSAEAIEFREFWHTRPAG